MDTEQGASRTTYLVIDGENIDATLGMSIFRGRPTPDQRPRWERVLAFAERAWEQPVKGLFFLNASSGILPMPFVQALLAVGFQPIPLSGGSTEKVVDIGIKRTLETLTPRQADVMLGTHDGDFEAEMEHLVASSRRTALIGFREFTSHRLNNLTSQGMEFFDLELDVAAFQVQLPRLRVIPLDEFDPSVYM